MNSQLVSDLNHRDDRLRTVAGMLLAGTYMGTQALAQSLSTHASPLARQTAATALGCSEIPGVAPVLWRSLQAERTLAVRGAIYQALGRLHATAVGSELVRHLNAYLGLTLTEDPELQPLDRHMLVDGAETEEYYILRSLIEALGVLQVGGAVAPLMVCLRQDVLVPETLAALTLLAAPQATPEILNALRRHGDYLALGVRALVAIGTPAVDDLIIALTIPELRGAAETALQRIGNLRGLNALLLALKRPAHSRSAGPVCYIIRGGV